jgi:exonuclease SbcC
MLLEKIILEGFLSYRKRQEIDLSDVQACLVLGRINDDAELSNGAGKSSLFEAIVVNFFGKGSGRADLLDSYINDSMTKMYLEVIFKIDGQRFKSIRSKTRNSSALYEIFLDTTSNEMKDATWKKTDKTIEEILGLSAKTYSSTTYLNERESLQIITGTSSERKEILRELLNIELYEKAARACSKKFDDLDKKIQVYINLIQDKQKQLEQEEQVKQNFKTLESVLKKAKRELKSKEIELKQQNEEKQRINVLIETENLIKTQIVQGNRDLTSLERAYKDAQSDILSSIEEVKSQTELYKRRKQSIEDSKEERLQIERTIKDQEKILEELDVVDKQIKELSGVCKSHDDEIKIIEKDIAVLKTELNAIKTTLTKLEKFGKICPIIEIECKILDEKFKNEFKDSKQNELDLIQGKIESLNKTLNEAILSLDVVKKEQRKLEIQAFSRQKENDKLSRAKLSLQTIINNENTFKEKEKDFEEYLKTSEEEQIDLTKQIEELKITIKSKKDNIIELEQKIDPKIQQAFKAINLAIEKLEDEIKTDRSEIDDVNQEIGETKNKIDEFEKMKTDIAHFAKINEENMKQKKLYQILSTIFGKDGIQKSIIKESIPMLEKYTTEFLKIFNEDSEKTKIKFDLDPKKQDGEFKKGGGLDILVLEEGKEPKDLQMYSGGETVRIVFSIVLSLAKLLSLRAGKKHEALIIDEKIAKLDARGILQFGEVIREISKIYKQVFVITHIESLKDLINGNEIIVNKTEEGSLVTVE